MFASVFVVIVQGPCWSFLLSRLKDVDNFVRSYVQECGVGVFLEDLGGWVSLPFSQEGFIKWVGNCYLHSFGNETVNLHIYFDIVCQFCFRRTLAKDITYASHLCWAVHEEKVNCDIFFCQVRDQLPRYLCTHFFSSWNYWYDYFSTLNCELLLVSKCMSCVWLFSCRYSF